MKRSCWLDNAKHSDSVLLRVFKMNNTTKQEIKFFINSMICTFKMNHKIDPEIDDELENIKFLKKHTNCKRCDTPLIVELDPEDSDYLIVSEESYFTDYFPEPDETTCKYREQIDSIEAYVRVLQDGDPEKENPKEILDCIDDILEKKI